MALALAAKNEHQKVVELLTPVSDTGAVLKSRDFIQTSGCDLLLSIAPPAVAERLLIAPNAMPLPRARTMLAAQSLRHRAELAQLNKSSHHRA